MAQLAEQHGGSGTTENSANGSIGATLLAVLIASSAGRHFRAPTKADYAGVTLATQTDNRDHPDREATLINPIRPSPNARGLTAPTRYGARRYADLFTPRQRVAIRILTKRIKVWNQEHPGKNELVLAMTLALGRCIDQSSAHVRWLAGIQAIASSFPRQAVQMTWDFVESVPTADESANFGAGLEWVAKVIERQGLVIRRPGQVTQADAEHLPLPNASCAVLFTDPPYYDAVPYSDLANFFFVWLASVVEPLGGGI
jgi:adenine-specific DNA methylase